MGKLKRIEDLDFSNIKIRAVNVKSQEEADALFANFNRIRNNHGLYGEIEPTDPPIIKSLETE